MNCVALWCCRQYTKVDSVNGVIMCGREVETLFHEFGHALQHMLTQEREGLVSGIRGIEWVRIVHCNMCNITGISACMQGQGCSLDARASVVRP